MCQVSVRIVGLLLAVFGLLRLLQSNGSLKITAAEDSMHTKDNIPVFYNLFVGNATDIPRAEMTVSEQLREIQPEHRVVYLHSAGVPVNLQLPIPISLLEHHNKASDIPTLRSLWKYCTKNPTSKVVYLHSGSSEALRAFLTAGALSRECIKLPKSCNVCSSRMSLIPYPHSSGEMWLARCSYIRKLIDPKLFESRMASINDKRSRDPCVGRNRFAMEHWVYSHPSAAPCDLCADKRFTWNYFTIPDRNFAKIIATAPRFQLQAYIQPDKCRNKDQLVKNRLAAYRTLYNETPSESWWGWKLFQQLE